MKIFKYETPTGTHQGTFRSCVEGQGSDVTYFFNRLETGQLDVVQGSKIVKDQQS